MTPARKVWWTSLAVAAALAALSGRVDAVGSDYGQEALTRALVTFAVARSLNGVISTAQGTELSVEPGGVGVNFSIGEILDPINDLIEQFSGIMLVAASSLGLQIVLLRMSAWWGVDALLLVAACAAVATLWVPKLFATFGTRPLRWLLIAMVLRFAVPAFMILSSIVFDTFLADEHMAATQALETTGSEIEAINEQATPPLAEDPSLVQQLGDMLAGSLRSLNARERLEQLRNRVANATEEIIDLIVIFVFQTIILPLVFLWSLLELLKAIIARTARL
ncbi:MAG TPA: hypothetical protein VLD39_04515 [Gammaproteobacteria bacterium]|nr:hypothetical protein [Gammaproteobacteria bacterium]